MLKREELSATTAENRDKNWVLFKYGCGFQGVLSAY